MPAYLNVETIRNAAELINATLKLKGHTSEDLRFVTIDWEELIRDQPEQEALEKLAVQENIYNNDKNVVNAIYSLIQDIDRHGRQHEATNQMIADKDAKIAKLLRTLASVEVEAATSEKKLVRLVNVETPALTKQIEGLSKKGKAQAREILRLRSLNSDLQSKYKVEKRRMGIENSELKTAMLHARGLSTTITYGRPLQVNGLLKAQKSRDLDVNPHIVHYNMPTVNNSETQTWNPGTEEIQPVVQREYENIATQLLELIERLMTENSKFARLARELTTYLDKVNDSIAPKNVKAANGPLLINPAHAINTQSIFSGTSDDAVPFELTSAPLLTSIYSNYDALSTLVDMAVVNIWENEGLRNKRKSDKMALLEDENKLLASSLQEALAALDEWRKHKKR